MFYRIPFRLKALKHLSEESLPSFMVKIHTLNKLKLLNYKLQLFLLEFGSSNFVGTDCHQLTFFSWIISHSIFLEMKSTWCQMWCLHKGHFFDQNENCECLKTLFLLDMLIKVFYYYRLFLNCSFNRYANPITSLVSTLDKRLTSWARFLKRACNFWMRPRIPIRGSVCWFVGQSDGPTGGLSDCQSIHPSVSHTFRKIAKNEWNLHLTSFQLIRKE